VALEPGLGIAHARLAKYYLETMDEERARTHARKATALDPNEPLVLGYVVDDAIDRNDFDTAIAYQRRVVTRDPLATIWRINFAVTLFGAGQLDEALSEFRRVLEINPDAGTDIELEIVRILVLQRRFDKAVAAADALPAGKYFDHAQALLHPVPGRAAAAESALQRLVEQEATAPAAPFDQWIMESVNLAEVLAWHGRYDEAFAVLDRKLEILRGRKEAKLFIWYFQHGARLAPFLKLIHADPRWAAFLAASA
jgi:tetratricopeptide (TPR) repeat protein